MTDNTTTDTPTDGAAAEADETTRTRTRRRTRAVEQAKDAAESTKGSARGSSNDGSSDSSDESVDGGARKRRRGRRGGRGRGKRKGGDETVKDNTTDESTQKDSASDGKGNRGKDSSGKGGAGKKHADSEPDQAAPESAKDAETRKAIASGGTRAAAKKQSRGNRGPSRRVSGVAEEVRRAIRDVPPRTMLAQRGDGLTQVVVVEDRTAVEHYVTRDDEVSMVGNIYLGRVQNVLSGMEAAFIDIGKGRNGVLYSGEVLFDEADLEEGETVRIEDALRPGQAVLVQVTKDPMGTKGPRLTMHLTLAGRYVVLAPDSDVFGISRKLTDKERDRLRAIVKEAAPEGHGIIVRTASEEIPDEAIKADIQRLVERWEKVREAATGAKPLDVVYEEPPLVVKVIRDNFSSDFLKLIVDGDELHASVVEYLEGVAPELLDKVEKWERTIKSGKEDEERGPVFTSWGVDEQLRKAMNRKVWLPSGGYLVIESTEAMKVIDVNTGKFTGKGDETLEEIVLKTNLEAVDELVRQLRLRDMGGIIIIDFIDMLLKANQDQVVRRLKRELLRDRTKTRVSEVSRLGLVQMTRKNVSHGLIESFSHTCKECEGRGFIVDL